MKSKIDIALSGLKDFQSKTVDYVFDLMCNKGQNKVLVADEVGLGKTIIAKGLLAKSFDKFLNTTDSKSKQFRVVYICSNLALANQNLNKLNFLGEDTILETDIDRLTYLAFKQDEKKGVFKISSLTPATSFTDRNGYGESDERALLYTILTDYEVFSTTSRRNGLRWLLKGNKEINNWDNLLKDYDYYKNDWIKNDVYSKFREKLRAYEIVRGKNPGLFEYLGKKDKISLWNALMKICDDLSGKNIHKFAYASELTSTLRRLLSFVCVQNYLKADFFILDEFQRYNQLIKWEQEEQAPAVEMAKAVFSIKDAKILMLSATPFKAYTNDFDEINGEVHYQEFKSVLKFLVGEKDDSFWKDYESDRKSFFKIISNSKDFKEDKNKAVLIKNKLENLYKTAIVRTERFIVSKDGNSLTKEMLQEPLKISMEDIHEFITLDKINKTLNELTNSSLPVPIEYIKSTPFPLSFLDGYQLKEKLKNHLLDFPELALLLKKSGGAWFSKKTIETYKPIISRRGTKLPNAKVRLLIDKALDQNGWKLLWIPPSLPYYNLQGAFQNTENFTKTLVFSSWIMVPRMIATVISYEAERKSIGKYLETNKEDGEEINYFSKPRSPKPRFTFKTIKGEDPKQMSNFALVYPCETLANIYNPVENLKHKKTYKGIRKDVKELIDARISELGLRSIGSGTGEIDKWFWAAPLLLDKKDKVSREIIEKWFASEKQDQNISIDTEVAQTDKSENSGKQQHLDYLVSVFKSEDISLPYLDDKKYDELLEHLTDMTLGSPAICTLRTLKKYYSESGELHESSYNISLALLSLFNKPESISIIRLTTQGHTFWNQALNYCIDGNIQSMLDEFCYLLYDCENFKDVKKLSNHLCDILNLRTSSIEVDDLNSFINERKKHAIRTNYAIDFGSQRVAKTHGSNRQINVRQTFNSPFRPFVLATTSIGQEGLDFHLYCKSIFHWNLPSNPIDFEQREGRINRYKGLVIRQNLIHILNNEFENIDQSMFLWDWLFKQAEKEQLKAPIPCDLIPYWHLEPEGGNYIERYVPTYPYSKDVLKYKDIIKVLTYYRLTFGQPSQQELIKTLENHSQNGLTWDDLKELIINLSPLLFKENLSQQTNSD